VEQTEEGREMAHIHLQDGALPLLWVAVWWAVATVILLVCLVRLRRQGLEPSRITLAALITATDFALFQVSIPLFGGVHLSLMPLTGLLLGPFLGPIAALIVNLFSAAIGHGGWGLVGANLVVNTIELVTASGVYRLTARWRDAIAVRATTAVFIALLAGNLAMIGIVLISGLQGVNQGIAATVSGLSVIAAVNMGAGAVEAVLCGYLLAYIARVRPGILGIDTDGTTVGH